MEHGLLHIDLRRSQPETVVQTIRINGAGPKRKEG
jgi:HSP20 family molecular chaperone IbpA